MKYFIVILLFLFTFPLFSQLAIGLGETTSESWGFPSGIHYAIGYKEDGQIDCIYCFRPDKKTDYILQGISLTSSLLLRIYDQIEPSIIARKVYNNIQININDLFKNNDIRKQVLLKPDSIQFYNDNYGSFIIKDSNNEIINWGIKYNDYIIQSNSLSHFLTNKIIISRIKSIRITNNDFLLYSIDPELLFSKAETIEGFTSTFDLDENRNQSYYYVESNNQISFELKYINTYIDNNLIECQMRDTNNKVITHRFFTYF